MNKIYVFFATGFGAGYFPKAPGTVGSLWGVLFAFLIYPLPFLARVAITLIYILFSFYVSSVAEKVFGEKDAQKIVVDEIVGQMVAFLFVPFSLIYFPIGFLLFRLFDIIKLFPARWAQDNMSGGVGVVMDDVVAGVQAGGVLIMIDFGIKYFA